MRVVDSRSVSRLVVGRLRAACLPTTCRLPEDLGEAGPTPLA